MRVTKLSAVLPVVAITGLCSPAALATSPYTPTIDATEDMEEINDDFYTPLTNDPLNDPNLAGLPPGVGNDDDGEPNGSPMADWEDERLLPGSRSVIEEVASGHLNNLGQPVATRDNSGHFAVLQFESLLVTHTNRDRVTPASSLGPYSAQLDLYLDPSLSAGSEKTFNWWAYVSGVDVTLTWAGITVTANPDQTWTLAVNGGGTLVELLEEGQWVTLEIQPLEDIVDSDLDGTGGIDFAYRVFNAGHTQVLGSAMGDDPAAAEWGSAAGPRMQTFENSASPVPYLFADNIGWGSPVMLVAPEPATLSVGAIALGALTLRRRR